VEGVATKVSGIIEKYQGDVLIHDDWGKRRLAYPIQRSQYGRYVYFNYMGPNSLVSELERNLRIDDSFLRFLTVRLADDIDVAARKALAMTQQAEVTEKQVARKAAEDARRAEEVRRAEEMAALNAMRAEQAAQELADKELAAKELAAQEPQIPPQEDDAAPTETAKASSEE
jgi:small subunit ribosomal protein S6